MDYITTSLNDLQRRLLDDEVDETETGAKLACYSGTATRIGKKPAMLPSP
jgi:hypothetical protein